MAATLVPFAKLKIFLDLEKNEADYPDLALIQEMVVAAFENHCGCEFELAERTETFFPEIESCRFNLIATPITAVTEVTLDDVALTVETDYIVMKKGIKLAEEIFEQELSVTYTGGYEEPYPNDLVRAALLQISYEFQRKDSVGVKTVITDGGTVTKENEIGLLREVKMLLSKYTNRTLLV